MHDLKAYQKVQVHFYSFLTFALVRTESSASDPDLFAPEKRASGTT
jgi:hypothetical protein